MKDSRMLVGKKVCVGIDVHARSYKVALVEDGERVCIFSCLADSDCLVEKLLKLTDGALSVASVYEAGFSGFVLHRKLVSFGIDNIVVCTATIKNTGLEPLF